MEVEKEPSKVEVKGDSPDAVDKKGDDDKPKEVEIEVNGKTVKLLSGTYSADEIKRLAIEQGVNIQQDFPLFEDGKEVTGEVVIDESGKKFRSISSFDYAGGRIK